jgi:predicted nucleotidyltransferase
MKPESKKEHNKEKQTNSVEQNLSTEYVPKKKLGDLPIENQMGIPEEVKKEMEKTKKEIEQFNEEISKKFKFIEAIGIIPVQVSQKIEEEYEIPEEEWKRKLIHVLVVIPEDNFKELSKVKLEAVQIGKKINDKFWFHILTPVDLWNLGLDSKFDILEAFAMSFPVFDKGILGAIRVSQIHKTLVLKKFERYVTSYVIGGSLVRGTATKTSDVDVFVVIDDTDVKKMPRLELKEKLRGIIYQYIAQAEAIAGVKNKLSPQIYLLTDFWESVKDAHPVIFTFIRDGIPLYDRGAFLPWKLLLRMGKIKPSPEAIDLFMSSGEKLEEVIKRRLLDIVVIDIFWSVSTPSQALLMLYGLPPGNVYETVKQIREIFVEKEKMLEKKYADIFEEICIKYYKGYEHEKVKEVSGQEIDKLLKDALDYTKRLKELREQIEKRVQEKSIEQVYKDVFGMLEALLKKKTEKEVIEEFDEQLVKTGRFPQRFLEHLKFILKTKDELSKNEKKEKKDDKTNQGETRDVDQARRFGSEIVNALIEYNQRCDFLSMDRSKFLIKGKERKAEAFFLQDIFVIENGKIFSLKEGKLKESSAEELRKQLETQQHKGTIIPEKALEELKKVFGPFELSY